MRELKSTKQAETAGAALDSILNTKPYTVMFRHYNRPFRPNHLPVDVFKRMVLSVKFQDRYQAGENQRADQMFPFWKKLYDSTELYERNVKQIEKSNLATVIQKGVQHAQEWLPDGMKIPDFYFFIHPNGGSTAFAIEGAQGYDFFQLSRNDKGDILIDKLVATIAHESHHLGLDVKQPKLKTPQDSLAFQLLMAFVAEGAASKFVDNVPGGCISKIRKRKEASLDEQGHSVWQKYTSEEQEIFTMFIDDFNKIYNKTYNGDSVQNRIRSYWLTGYKGRAYFIGSELYGAVYKAFGKKKAMEVISKPHLLLPIYNEALKKKKLSCYRLPQWLTDRFKSMSE